MNKKELYRQRIWDYLIANPCVYCGESDPVCLDFDHRRDKLYNVSTMVNRGMAWDKIKAKINKCLVVCSNCQRKRTAKTRGWYLSQRLDLEF